VLPYELYGYKRLGKECCITTDDFRKFLEQSVITATWCIVEECSTAGKRRPEKLGCRRLKGKKCKCQTFVKNAMKKDPENVITKKQNLFIDDNAV